MVILVCGHSRSGNHFTIDSLVKNFKDASFGIFRPGYAAIENLVVPHDSGVTELFYDFIFNYNKDQEIRICKTHLLPEEIETALSRDDYFLNKKDRVIIDFLYNEAKVIYIQRDVKDVMVSLYYFMKLGGGYQVGLRERLAHMSIAEFIRSPNYHIYPPRGFADFDRNRIVYWAYHVQQWMKRKVCPIQYETLSQDFESTLKKISEYCGGEEILRNDLSKPSMSDQKNSLINRVLKKLRIKLSSKESTAVSPYKGISGSHKAHFSDEDYRFIDKNIQMVNMDVESQTIV
ncbi:MAG: sulfotransferase domain-containing protein [Candidatus Omnitrophica bacterium]|nr:sulfotransferase domain-containing protein [Candidatus Omnitrophota bacterium]